VAAAKGKQQVVAGCRLEVFAPGPLRLGLGLPGGGDVDDLLKRQRPVLAPLGQAVLLVAVGPQPVAGVEAGGQVGPELVDALGLAGGQGSVVLS
jgi:hypothetical protein